MPESKKYCKPGFAVVTFVTLKQAFGMDYTVFLRAQMGLLGQS